MRNLSFRRCDENFNGFLIHFAMVWDEKNYILKMASKFGYS